MTPPAMSGNDPRSSVPGPRACSLRPGFRMLFLDTTCWLEQPYTPFSGLSRKTQILKSAKPKDQNFSRALLLLLKLRAWSALVTAGREPGWMESFWKNSQALCLWFQRSGYQEMEGTSFACLSLDLATWRSKGISVCVGIHPGSNLGLLAPLPSGC